MKNVSIKMPPKRKAVFDVSGRYVGKRVKTGRSIILSRKSKPGYGRRLTKYSKKRFNRRVRKALLQTTETGYKTKVVVSGAGSGINHDTLRKYVLWDVSDYSIFPTQGLGDGNRIGDEIYVTGMMIRATFQVPYDRRNTKIRLWYVPYNTDQGFPDQQSQFMHNVTGNTFLDPIQTKRWPGVKYLGQYQVKSTDQPHIIGETLQDKTIMVKKWLPIYRKVAFKEDGSVVPVSGLKEHGWLIASAYDSITSATTDTVVSRCEMSCTMYYKDP